MTLPRLHIVSDDTVLASPAFTEAAAAVLKRGGHDVALHLRGHGTRASVLHALAERLVPAANDAGAMLLINDRIDLALASGAHGVQLGRRSLPLAGARSLLGSRTIGYSAHSAGETAEAAASGADFVLIGAIWPSASHRGQTTGGVELVRASVAATSRPVLAIGGVQPDHMRALARAGAHGAAVLGGIWAGDPIRGLEGYLEALTHTFGA